jgi:hypothetical protein
MNPSLPSSIASQLAALQGVEATPQTPREFLMQVLEIDGCAPSLDTEQDIVFRHEGFVYCLCLLDDDPEFVRLVLPNFHTVAEPGELSGCLLIADRVNRCTKQVKLVSSRSDDGVTLHAVAEFLVADPLQVAPVLLRAASGLAGAVRDFYTLMRLL